MDCGGLRSAAVGGLGELFVPGGRSARRSNDRAKAVAAIRLCTDLGTRDVVAGVDQPPLQPPNVSKPKATIADAARRMVVTVVRLPGGCGGSPFLEPGWETPTNQCNRWGSPQSWHRSPSPGAWRTSPYRSGQKPRRGSSQQARRGSLHRERDLRDQVGSSRRSLPSERPQATPHHRRRRDRTDRRRARTPWSGADRHCLHGGGRQPGPAAARLLGELGARPGDRCARRAFLDHQRMARYLGTDTLSSHEPGAHQGG